MTTKTVSVKVVGDASSARKELGSVASEAEKLGSRAGRAFGALANLAGQSGAFGPLSEIMSAVGEGLDFIAQNGKRTGTVMIGVGGAMASAGLLMQSAASKDVEAHKQLKQAVENSGNAYGQYEGRIEKAIRSNEKFGHTADETQDALRKLTDATGDPAKALQMMGLVADIAASKHIALADAAALVAKIFNGTGGKALAAYGIHIDKSKDKTTELNRALTELAQKTGGQAAASADTFGGRMDAMKAKIADTASSLSQKFGPALTVTGAAVAALGTVIEIGTAAKAAYAAMTARVAAAQAAAATSAGAEAEAEALAAGATAEQAAAANAAAAANTRLSVSARAAAASQGMVGASMMTTAAKFGAGGLAVVGVTYGINKLIDVFTHEATPSITKLAASLDDLGKTGRAGGEFDKFFGGGKFQQDFKLITDDSLWGSAKRGIGDYTSKVGFAGSALQLFGASAEDAKKRNEQLASALAQLKPEAAVAAFEQLTRGMNPAAVERFKSELIKINPALDALLNAAPGAAAGLDKVARAANGAALGAMSAADRVAYMGRVFGRIAGNMSIDTAMIGAADASRGLSESLKANGRDFSIASVKGAANRSALIKVAQANMDVRDAMLKVPGGAHAANVAYERSTEKLRDQLTAAHFTKAEIDKLIGRYQAIPRTVKTAVTLTDRATPAARYLKQQLEDLNGNVYTVYTRMVTQRVGSLAGGTTKYSMGGAVRGGIPGRDSVPILAKPREYVIRDDGSNLADAYAFYGRKMPSAGRAASPSGGGGVVINISGALDPLAVGRQVEQALMKVKNISGALAFQQ